MTGFVDERYEDCGQTADWTLHGVEGLVSALMQSSPSGLAPTETGAMSRAFYTALHSRDVMKAAELGQVSGNWPALAMAAIAELDQAWQNDTLSIGEVAEAYWTLRRTLEELTVSPTRTAKPSLSIGKAFVYIPRPEQHTFGPQMLVDRINRVGWDAHLLHSLDAGALMKKLNSEPVDVLGISIGTDNRLDGLADLISDAKRSSMNPDIKTLIGGNAISGTSSQYGFLGADWVATTSEDAMLFFERLWSDLRRREGRFHG